MRSVIAGAAAGVVVLTWTLVTTGHASPGDPEGPCALPRTRAHHSEGLSPWNPSYRRPLGRVDAAMVFLSFPDSAPSLTTETIAADHIPEVRNFFSASSYGKFDFNLVPIQRFFRMPADSTAYHIQRDWASGPKRRYIQDAIAAADSDVDFSAYDVVFFIADPDAPGVDSDATKIVNLAEPVTADGARLAHIGTIFESHPPDRNVFAHESAHTFDLPDLYQRPGEGTPVPDWNTEVGDWDLMGDQKGMAPDLFAWHKWKLGWLGQAQVACLTARGTTRHTIAPLEAPGGVKLVVVRESNTSALAVEVRSKQGNDVRNCTEGVLVYRVRSDIASGRGPITVMDAHPDTAACEHQAAHPELADAPFGVGEEFDDPSAGSTVKVVGRGPTGSYTVEVTRRPV